MLAPPIGMNETTPAREACEPLVRELLGNICLLLSSEYPLNLKGLRQTRRDSAGVCPEVAGAYPLDLALAKPERAHNFAYKALEMITTVMSSPAFTAIPASVQRTSSSRGR